MTTTECFLYCLVVSLQVLSLHHRKETRDNSAKLDDTELIKDDLIPVNQQNPGDCQNGHGKDCKTKDVKNQVSAKVTEPFEPRLDRVLRNQTRLRSNVRRVTWSSQLHVLPLRFPLSGKMVCTWTSAMACELAFPKGGASLVESCLPRPCATDTLLPTYEPHCSRSLDADKPLVFIRQWRKDRHKPDLFSCRGILRRT